MQQKAEIGMSNDYSEHKYKRLNRVGMTYS